MKRAKKLTIDVRGLASHEKKEGEMVELAGGVYRVVKIENGKATLERVKQDVQPR